MKRNKKIALCGIVAALATVFLLLSYFPYFTYAVPAVAGLFMMMVVIEINAKWAVAAYIASAVPIFLLAEQEAKLLYVCLFGYYPILKAVLERINNRVLEWVLKLAVFNAAVLTVYLLMSGLFQISLEDFGVLGKYGAYIFLAVGNGVFVLYDFAISRVSVFYMIRLHPQIKRLFKGA